MNPQNERNADMHLAKLAQIVKFLDTGEYSNQEIAAQFECSGTSISKYMRELIRAGEAHISGWRKKGRGIGPIFTAGPGSTAPRPVTLRTLRATPGYRKAKREAERRAANPEPAKTGFRDPLVTAFFGR